MSSKYHLQFLGKKNAQEYEQQYSGNSYSDILWHIEQHQLLEFLKQYSQHKQYIDYLDFAAGTGRVISFLEKHVHSATGIEISPTMAEIAKKKLQRGQMLCTDITAPDTQIEGQYDLITAFRFFLNAEHNMKQRTMKVLAARLKDESSRLIFNNHGNLWSHKLFMWPVHTMLRIGQGYVSAGNYMTLRQANKLADEAGLVIENVMSGGILGPKFISIMSFEQLLTIESRLAKTILARYLSVNQMYVARLKT